MRCENSPSVFSRLRLPPYDSRPPPGSFLNQSGHLFPRLVRGVHLACQSQVREWNTYRWQGWVRHGWPRVGDWHGPPAQHWLLGRTPAVGEKKLLHLIIDCFNLRFTFVDVCQIITEPSDHIICSQQIPWHITHNHGLKTPTSFWHRSFGN